MSQRYTNDVLNVTGPDSMPNPDLATNQATKGLWGFDIRNLLLAHDNEFALKHDGDPNGNLESRYVGRQCWDYTNGTMYICTTAGTTDTAVWSSLTALIAAQVNQSATETAVAMAIALG